MLAQLLYQFYLRMKQLLVQLLQQQLVQLPRHEPGHVLLVYEGVRDLPVLLGTVVLGGAEVDEGGDCESEVED